ncbi:hypothetical protein DRP53_00215 [candidate division WOR-3 bacterium]|uniref:NADH:quinone oxidoreductase/Mrp antiporter transmembrane domain-containing protein n=1 Tax=candidate division WOR-3 bacterium TaxID=2052148 RepID=A0A660SP59_UNCW3|nr:MAG: hypothetical protein DRP53_00215 [candidate division WOR-3 bacterium]
MSGPIWLSFEVDGLALTLTCLFSLITLFSLIYSLISIRRFGFKTEYYVILLLLAASGISFLYARNLILLYALWEINTFAIWRLVGFHRRDEDIEHAERTFLINFFAAVIMLVGLGLIYTQSGTFDLTRMKGLSLPPASAYLILVGILAKSATVPLHVWLPYAYESAPIPVAAMLASISENLGLILFLRLFRQTFSLPENFYLTVMVIAAGSILIGGGTALVTNRIRRILAYSTISQLGFILIGFAAGGTYGIIGGLLYIIGHSLSKPGIFYAVGIVEERTKAVELGGIGFGPVMPTLGPGFALLAGSVVGLPPFIGFFAKLYVIIGVLKVNLVLAALTVGGALFTLLYFLRLYNGIFKGKTTLEVSPSPVSGMIVLVLILAVVTILAGIAVIIPNPWIEGVMKSWL